MKESEQAQLDLRSHLWGVLEIELVKLVIEILAQEGPPRYKIDMLRDITNLLENLHPRS